MTKLNESAMLASLSISYYQGARTDKKVTAEVALNHKVKSERAGHYRKFAIDTKNPKYQAVITAAGALRTAHYTRTLPWGDEGARILTAMAFDEYSKEIRAARSAFDKAVAEFIVEFPSLKAAARVELNGMYNEADYPLDIKAKFGVRQSILPLPDAGDFRTKLHDGAVDEIKANIEQEVQRGITEAMKDPYQRLHDHISRMVKALSNPKAIFRDTLVTGLGELCSVLPGLNLTGDANLEELRRKSEAMISGIEAQDLRDRPSARRKVAAQAREIQDAMSEFMGA